jgi:chemotaxis protein CheD
MEPLQPCPQMITLFSGEWHVIAEPSPDHVIATVLGSCIAVCMRDPHARVGGMNHFLLPGSGNEPNPQRAYYGEYAMQCLIDGILAQGGKRERLEIKIFGGANLSNEGMRIGSQNAAFICDYMDRHGFTIASSDMEGIEARRVHYFPATGKVMLKRI